MKYRTTTVLADKDPGAAGTEIIPLNLLDIISRLTVTYHVGMFTNKTTAHYCADVSRIELVDGSDVLFSMTGYEAQALNIYDRRVATMSDGQNMGGNHYFMSFGLDFGRYLFDPELALNPAQFDNLVLKITYNEVTAGATDKDNHIAVYADVFDEKVVSPVGFLMSKEHWSAPLSAGAFEYVKLPTDYPIRQLILRAFKDAKEPKYTCVEAKIDEDNEKRIPFNWVMDDYQRLMMGVWLPISEGIVGNCMPGGVDLRYVTPTGYRTAFMGATQRDDAFYSGWANEGGIVTFYGTAGSTVIGIARGWYPHHCWQFPFGDQRDLDDWYDVTTKGAVRLRLKGGDTTPGDAMVVLQQLRRY